MLVYQRVTIIDTSRLMMLVMNSVNRAIFDMARDGWLMITIMGNLW